MQKNNKIDKWISSQKREMFFSVKKINLLELKKWNITTKNIYHTSKKFFKIIGIRVKTNFSKKKNWDQPIILQKEKGILGILRRKYKGSFQYLIQAKMEPGNINKLQLSPTVQATKSNYSRVHGGKKVKYLNLFKNVKKKLIIVNSLQSEQGGRFLFKFNNNLIIKLKKKIKLHPNYIWLTKNQLVRLINKNNLLNMDSISVFSCALEKNIRDFPENSFRKIQYWYNNLKKKYSIKIKIISLLKLKNWKLNNKCIFHKNKKYFSIIGIKVLANSREVGEWEQPIIQEEDLGLSGFLVKKIYSTYHYLVSFSVKPGLKHPSLSCTFRTSNLKNCLNDRNHTNIEKFYLKKYFTHNTQGKIRYNKIQSDEGGRFFQSQSKNIIIQIPENKKIKINKNYIWMSHNQVLHFMKKGIFNIEARILFTCFNLKNIL